MAAQDNYAFVGNGGLFQVFDISNPLAPKIIGELQFGGLLVYDMALRGNFAFIADGDVKVIDISQPNNPRIAAELPVPRDFASRIIASDNYAYVGTFGGQLIIVDISMPTLPIIKSTTLLSDEFVALMVIYGQHLFIKTESPIDPIYIYDVSDPTNPTRVGFVVVRTFAFAVANQRLYPCREDSSFQTWDLTTPATPTLLSRIKTPFAGQAVVVRDNLTYVIAGSPLLAIIDISDPSQPFVRGNLEGWPRTVPTSLAVVSNLVVAKTSIGFWIFNVSDPDHPSSLTHFTAGDAALKIEIVKDTAYLACLKAGLFVVEISDPKNSRFISSLAIGGSADDITVLDSLAYLSGYPFGEMAPPQLRILNVSRPNNPQIIGQVSVLSRIPLGGVHETAVAVSGRLAFVTHDLGMSIVDISDKYTPRLMTWIETEKLALGVAISGNFACLANSEAGLRIFDISDPENPQEKSNSPGFASGVATRNDTAFVALSGGLAVLKILSSGVMIKLGEVATPGSRSTVDIAIQDHFAYMAYNEDLVVVDFSNPSQPLVVNHTITPAYSNGVAAKGNNVFVAGGAWALQVYRNSLVTQVGDRRFDLLPATPQLYPSYPNPIHAMSTIEYEVPSAGLVELKIFNSIGEEIAELANDWQNGGRFRTSFDVKNLPSGIYFCRMRFNNNWQAIQKIAVLR